MATSENQLTYGMTGTLGKQLVFRNRGGKTFVSKYPDMSKVVPSEAQLEYKSLFREAVRFAQSIVHDPEKKAAYKVKKGATVYNTAIKDYMRQHQG
jgi:hypothetical protein